MRRTAVPSQSSQSRHLARGSVMGMLRALAVMALLAPVPAVGQQDQTLADIRQELSALYVDIQRLRTELSTTGGLTQGTLGNTPLDRLNAIEVELQRLTAKTEELEFRINRITVDGTNRIGDLEFRLCELEPACDIGMLGDTPSLGGTDNGAEVTAPETATETTGPQLAVSEQQDFERAQEALAAGDFRGASDQFAAFIQTYPGGPLSAQAYFYRGLALEGMGEISQAARAFLDSFSGEPDGEVAARALYKLGETLGELGQTADACVTLGEVPTRFPGTQQAQDAVSERQRLGCS